MTEAQVFLSQQRPSVQSPEAPSEPSSPAQVRCPRSSVGLCQQIHPSQPFLSTHIEAKESDAGDSRFPRGTKRGNTYLSTQKIL